MSGHIRLTRDGRRYTIDSVGSEYVGYLHSQLQFANKLADEVMSLNPNYLHLGAGKLANMQELAKSILPLK